MGLIAEIAGIMQNMKGKRTRATPETVFALAVQKEGGKTNHEEHEQEQSSEAARNVSGN